MTVADRPLTSVRPAPDTWPASFSREPAGWRTAILTRVVALAIVAGLALGEGRLPGVALPLATLVIVAAVASVVDLGPSPVLARMIPVAEACVAAVVVSGAPSTMSMLLVYLAVPPLVAGLRLGPLSVLNALLVTVLTVAAGGAALTEPADRADLASGAVLWVAVGVGVGLVGARQSRQARALELVQAPYEPARRAAVELYDRSRDLPGSLDPVATARALASVVATSAAGENRCGAAVYLSDTAAPERPLARRGDPAAFVPGDSHAALAAAAAADRRAHRDDDMLAVPLRSGDRTFGSVVVTGPCGRGEGALDRIQRVADEHAVQLEAALFFERVRDMASTEERNRLARDLHDGAIQEIAALGYVIDELAVSSDDPHSRATATQVRTELTRVMRELRHSVFELRHGLETRDLATALADHADHVRRLGDLEVHLHTEVIGDPVRPTDEAEVLRIVQEAVSNVRKHADARTVWIDYRTNGSDIRLTVEDDGLGAAGIQPRENHFGLRTMTERARRIGAELSIDDRPGGGTRLTVATATAPSPTEPASALVEPLETPAPPLVEPVETPADVRSSSLSRRPAAHYAKRGAHR